MVAILRFWMAVDAPPDSDEHYVRSIEVCVSYPRGRFAAGLARVGDELPGGPGVGLARHWLELLD